MCHSVIAIVNFIVVKAKNKKKRSIKMNLHLLLCTPKEYLCIKGGFCPIVISDYVLKEDMLEIIFHYFFLSKYFCSQSCGNSTLTYNV